MESRGVIESTGGRGRRGKQLSLTAQGWALLTSVIPVWQSAREELSRKMGSEQLSLTTTMMKDLAKTSTSC
jgi:DNA-binding MarR family transcriptional regulator